MRKRMKSLLTTKLFLVMLVALVAGGFASCKSQKKIAAEQAAAEKAMVIEQAKQDLLNIISDPESWTVAEKEAMVSEIKSMNLEDPEVVALLEKVDEIIAKEKAALKRLEEERLRNEQKALEQEEQKFMKLEDLFDNVANNKSMEMSNRSINEALKYFASPDVPVLIIVFMDGDIKDYDKPTTIKKYLEYVKDQGRNVNKIHNVQFDAIGKITELELIKM
jgi:oligoendopeptidase F